MSSSSEALKNSKAARAHTASPGTPLNSPTKGPIAVLEAAVCPDQSSQPVSKSVPLVLPGTSDATKKEADGGQASKVECKTIREV